MTTTNQQPPYDDAQHSLPQQSQTPQSSAPSTPHHQDSQSQNQNQGQQQNQQSHQQSSQQQHPQQQNPQHQQQNPLPPYPPTSRKRDASEAQLGDPSGGTAVGNVMGSVGGMNGVINMGGSSQGGVDDYDDDDDEGDKGMTRAGRRKIKIEYIDDKSRRHITFSKRKAGIMKKAYELSTLTGTQVLLLVASETGHVYTFATPKLQPLITKPDGKNLIQACLNAPDPMPAHHQHQQVPQQVQQQVQQQQHQQQGYAGQQGYGYGQGMDVRAGYEDGEGGMYRDDKNLPYGLSPVPSQMQNQMQGNMQGYPSYPVNSPTQSPINAGMNGNGGMNSPNVNNMGISPQAVGNGMYAMGGGNGGNMSYGGHQGGHGGHGNQGGYQQNGYSNGGGMVGQYGNDGGKK